MRHRVSGRKLGRTASHRKATLSALSTSLIEHKRITTTVAKAKETQQRVEKLITRAKIAFQKESTGASKDVAARREVGKIIKSRTALRELFDEIAPKVTGRNGGYTRVVKLGQRDGDGAHVAVLELVDYNEAITKKEKQKKAAKTAQTAKKAAAAATASAEESTAAEPSKEKTSSKTVKKSSKPAADSAPAEKPDIAEDSGKPEEEADKKE